MPRWTATAITIVGSAGVSMAVWVASKDALRATAPDEHHLAVPIVTFAVAGLLWGLTQPGAQRAIRASVATLVGAIAGGIGGFVLGTSERHVEAFQDGVLSGASIGRAVLWALVGGGIWAALVAAGTATAARTRAVTGAAIGGAAIGAAMGLLAGTPLGREDLFATDAWFTGWIVIDDDLAGLVPIVLMAIMVPLAAATLFGRSVATRSKAPVWVALVACLLLPFAGAGIGNASAIEEARDRGGVEFDGPSAGADVDVDVDGDPSASPSAADDSSAAPAVPGASEESSSEAAPSAAPPTPEAQADPPAPAEPPAEPGPVYYRPVVATDIDVGFPIATDLRLAGTNTLGQGLNVRLVVGEVRRNDQAPSTPAAALSCSADPRDGVFPFYMQVAPYAASLSRVRVVFSQGATGLADTAFNPMTVEFHDTTGQRCASAVDGDFVNSSTAIVWETLADGETGGVYGYFIVSNYFDDAGNPIGAGSSVVGPVLDLNRTATSWTTTVNGSATVPFSSADGYTGAALYLTPP